MFLSRKMNFEMPAPILSPRRDFKKQRRYSLCPIGKGTKLQLKCIGKHGKLPLKTSKILPRHPDLSPLISIQHTTAISLCGIPILSPCLHDMVPALIRFKKRLIIFTPSNIPTGSSVARYGEIRVKIVLTDTIQQAQVRM